MIDKNITEQAMREMEVPFLKTIDELIEYIKELESIDDDYGTACYAMSMAGVAAFNYMSSRLGCTGFQASMADLDMTRRNRLLKGPFMILKAEDMLYPQYNLRETLNEAMDSWQGWVSEQCEKLLEQKPVHASGDVVRHWKLMSYMGQNSKESTGKDAE